MAEYFANSTLSGTPDTIRTDADIGFDWMAGAPSGTGLSADGFSVRWSGHVSASELFTSLSFDTGAFNIDAATGALTFQTPPDYDAPTDTGADNVYNVQVSVTDSGGLSSRQEITVAVTDLYEFIAIAAGLPSVTNSSVAWGDYDKDGDLDILLTGLSSSGRVAEVYRNDGGAFNAVNAGLPGVQDSSAAWGDYDSQN